jgi:MoxR-like ATPase
VSPKRTAAERVATVEDIAPSPVRQKFMTTLREITASLIERDEEVILFLVALVTHEHVCIQGPPGTGKSLLADSVLSWIDGPVYSELMMKDLPPEGVFGPLDIPKLTGKTTGTSEYVRLVKGYLPDAVVAFLDEIWKATGSVLNRNLKISHERQFRNGAQPLVPHVPNVPLISMFAASNEWPNDQEGGKELAALMDRFLLRKDIKPISTQAGRERLLWVRDHVPKLSTKITRDELVLAKKEATALPWKPESKAILNKILRELAKQGIMPGDRRQYKSIDVASGYAYLSGGQAVEPEHLEVLQHVLWVDPNEQPKAVAEIVGKLANPTGTQINGLLLEAQTIFDGSDHSELSQAAVASAKLNEVYRKISSLKNSDKQQRALEYVAARIADVKAEAVKKM